MNPSFVLTKAIWSKMRLFSDVRFNTQLLLRIFSQSLVKIIDLIISIKLFYCLKETKNRVNFSKKLKILFALHHKEPSQMMPAVVRLVTFKVLVGGY